MTIHPDGLTTALDRRGDDRRGTPEAAFSLDALEDFSLDGSIPRRAIHRVLGNDRRRAILDRLLAEDGPLEVRQLVAWIADAEHDPTAVTPLHDLRQRVHVSLCRTHLPLLERYRVLAYDREQGLVAPGARLTAFESVLDVDAIDGALTGRSK